MGVEVWDGEVGGNGSMGMWDVGWKERKKGGGSQAGREKEGEGVKG